MLKKSLAIFAAATLFAMCGFDALAKTGFGSRQTAVLSEGAFVLPPVSFTQFCLSYPQECPEAGGAKAANLTRKLISELRAVNQRVNRAITPSEVAPGNWALDIAQGDCNDYAVQKRHELLRRGWPAGTLALTVVRTPWGEGHLVLMVRTNRGDLVLDNLRPEIRDWRRSRYEGLMRQSAENPKFWVSLAGPPMADPTIAKQDARASTSAPPPIGNDTNTDRAAAPLNDASDVTPSASLTLSSFAISATAVGETGNLDAVKVYPDRIGSKQADNSTG